MFFSIDEDSGYERPRPYARQAAHKSIGHANVGFLPEEQDKDRKLAENEDKIEPEQDYLELVDHNDETAAEPTQNEYDYIDGRMLGLGTLDFGRQRTETESRCNLCSGLKKFKIIVIATIVSILLVTVIVGIILGLILRTSSSTIGTSENESDKITTGPMDGQMTIDSGSSPKGPGLLVIIGGYKYNGTFTYYDTVQIYTVDKGRVTWKKYGTPAPYHWSRGGTATSGGNIYIVGGWAKDSDGQEVELVNRRAAKYNVGNDRWKTLPNRTISAGRVPVVSVINDQLFSVDGDNVHPPTHTEKLNLLDIDSGWKKGQAIPPHNVYHTQAVVIGNTAYICAGTWPAIKTVISWTYGNTVWFPKADMNIARTWYHGTVSDGISNIWVVGGCDPDDCWPNGFIKHYNVTDNTWSLLHDVPNLERYDYKVQVCSFWQGHIYVLFSKYGSVDLIPKFHIYNIQTGKWYEDSTELVQPVYKSMSAILPGISWPGP